MHGFNKAVFIIKTVEHIQTCLELYNINITAINKINNNL